MMTGKLETERLILRQFGLDDLDDLYEYASSPHVGPAAGWKPHENKDETWDILVNFIKNDEVWAIVSKEQMKVIGSIGLHPDKRRDNKNIRMLGYVLAESAWGHGFMTEAAQEILKYAFESLNLDLVSVYHYPFNQKSKRVIEKCGFIYEGTLRMSSALYDGRVLDDVCYSLKSSEYFDLSKK